MASCQQLTGQLEASASRGVKFGKVLKQRPFFCFCSVHCSLHCDNVAFTSMLLFVVSSCSSIVVAETPLAELLTELRMYSLTWLAWLHTEGNRPWLHETTVLSNWIKPLIKIVFSDLPRLRSFQTKLRKYTKTVTISSIIFVENLRVGITLSNSPKLNVLSAKLR